MSGTAITRMASRNLLPAHRVPKRKDFANTEEAIRAGHLHISPL
jgi:hypothetical protein